MSKKIYSVIVIVQFVCIIMLLGTLIMPILSNGESEYQQEPVNINIFITPSESNLSLGNSENQINIPRENLDSLKSISKDMRNFSTNYYQNNLVYFLNINNNDLSSDKDINFDIDSLYNEIINMVEQTIDNYLPDYDYDSDSDFDYGYNDYPWEDYYPAFDDEISDDDNLFDDEISDNDNLFYDDTSEDDNSSNDESFDDRNLPDNDISSDDESFDDNNSSDDASDNNNLSDDKISDDKNLSDNVNSSENDNPSDNNTLSDNGSLDDNISSNNEISNENNLSNNEILDDYNSVLEL